MLLLLIVGHLPAEEQCRASQCRQRPDRSWLVEATMDFGELMRGLGLASAASDDTAPYRSVGGFVLSHLGRVPSEGDKFDWGGLAFEVLDMDRKRIDKLLVTPIPSHLAVGERPMEIDSSRC